MKSNMKNLERLKSLAEMLTMIFSIGQKMPVTYEGMFKFKPSLPFANLRQRRVKIYPIRATLVNRKCRINNVSVNNKTC